MKVDQWNQLFSDGTGRRKTTIHNLVIVVIDEYCLRPLIISNFIILKGETSDQHVEAVMSTVTGFGKRLQRWADVLDHSQPSYQNDI